MALNNQPRSYQFWNAIAATPPDFNLDAGAYGLTVATGGFTNYQLQKRMPDAAGTYAPMTAVLVAAGYVVIQLPAGQYRLVVTATALIGTIEKIDTGRAR